MNPIKTDLRQAFEQMMLKEFPYLIDETSAKIIAMDKTKEEYQYPLMEPELYDLLAETFDNKNEFLFVYEVGESPLASSTQNKAFCIFSVYNNLRIYCQAYDNNLIDSIHITLYPSTVDLLYHLKEEKKRLKDKLGLNLDPKYNRILKTIFE